MTPIEWDTWLRNWLREHPLKAPGSAPERLFTDQVMARIRPTQAPAPVLRRASRPRLAFALGGTLAAVLALAFWLQQPAEQANTSSEEQEVLQLWLRLEEAEPRPSGQWLRLEEAEPGAPALWEESEEDLLEELLWLDEMELAVS